MIASPIRHPSDETIRQLGNTIIQRLFHKRYQNEIIRCRTQDIVKLVNYVSTNSTHIPDDIQIHWGDAIATLSSPKEVLHKFGT